MNPEALLQQAKLDQAEAAMRDLARASFKIYRDFFAAGFSAAEAFTLTRDYWRLQVVRMVWPDSPPPYPFGAE